ncbi:type IV secretory system conjugative DNA transfer family protein [Bradyrhizobium sp. 930_D9_N1_4]|uniref:type IV secretory system conjugative DNA transfer family protein n=1 Tax=Bradyrhizobium sp. 930_D9_N1_4 TaxID=3240374 RepID=UPI003F8A2D3B
MKRILRPFGSEFSRWGKPVERAELLDYYGLPQMDEGSRALFETLLPRGVTSARLERDRERVNYFMSPGQLLTHRYRPGQLMIGKLGSSFLGHLDDRPLIMLAGTRAGKTSTILMPNLYLYSGSMLVLDPKGELAAAAAFRRRMGHNVYVLDPFGQTQEKSACFNPLAELDPESPAIIDDVMAVANALVPDGDEGNSKHFNNGARAILRGLILLVLTLPPSERHLVTVRELLCLTYKPLVDACRRAAAKAMAAATEGEKQDQFDRSSVAVRTLFAWMVGLGNRYGGVAAAIGERFLQMSMTERSSHLSTAAVHTDFLDSLLLRRTLRHSDFRLADLRGDRPTTIFMCLPVGRMEQHFRWMRLVVQLACSKLEAMGTYPRERPPILFMLEEFAALGHMDFMERASAYFPGFGIKPWFILQDITQLRRNYKSWESFLGNSGMVQMFANGDGETVDWASRRLGKLIMSFEAEMAFAREHRGQLLLMKGLPPAPAMRLSHDDVAGIRGRDVAPALLKPTLH